MTAPDIFVKAPVLLPSVMNFSEKSIDDCVGSIDHVLAAVAGTILTTALIAAANKIDVVFTTILLYMWCHHEWAFSFYGS
jgi:hypothetical protein